MRINNNIMALNTQRQLTINNTGTSKSLEKLSSGYRINRAGDDAAGLAISEKMRAQIRGLTQASRNAQDGISLVQAAEGALTETHAILQRMRELAVQSSTDTNTGIDRGEIQKEIDQLAKEITRISNTTEFNTQKLLNGGINDTGIGSLKFHVGANQGQDISLSIAAMDAKSLGVSRDVATGGTVDAAVAGKINSSKLSGSDYGEGIINGAELTFDYTAAVVGSGASPADAITDTGNSGFTFAFTNGAALNDYTIKLGTTDAATATSVDVDTTAKTITINGDFSADDLVAAGDLQTAINNALSGKGISITVTVTGNSKSSATGDIGTISNGADTQTASPATLQIISNKGHSQTLTINPDATSIDIKDGAFKGLSFDMKATESLKTIDETDDKLTLTVTTAVAAKANFSGKTKIADAVAEAGIDVSTQSAASSAVSTIQNAIETVSAERSKLGALQNRLEHTIKNLDTSAENLQASESRIRDVDMAKEMMEFTKQNILMQAATAMLAQANMAPQTVLKLLG